MKEKEYSVEEIDNLVESNKASISQIKNKVNHLLMRKADILYPLNSIVDDKRVVGHSYDVFRLSVTVYVNPRKKDGSWSNRRLILTTVR